MSRPHYVTVIVTMGYLTICAILSIFIHNLKGEGMTRKTYRIKELKSGVWACYLGRTKAAEFWTEEEARKWAFDMVNPVQTYGHKIHPVTGVPADEGKMWVTNIMSGTVVQISDRTPYTCSPASETYWST